MSKNHQNTLEKDEGHDAITASTSPLLTNEKDEFLENNGTSEPIESLLAPDAFAETLNPALNETDSVVDSKVASQSDTEESAYSSSDAEAEAESSDEEAYIDEVKEESSSEEYVEDDEDYSDEEEYGRPKKNRSSYGRTSYSNTFNYTPNYGPIQPMPPNLSSIPMFAKLAAASSATSKDGKVSSQLHSLAKDTVTTLASVDVNGGGPESSDEKTSIATDGAKVQPSQDLKNSLANMMMATPEWRNMLLSKLQANRNMSAEQARNLGIKPASTNLLPIQPITSIPDLTLQHQIPQYKPPSYQPIQRLKKPIKKKKIIFTEPIGEKPIAKRRESRSNRKSLDYSKFYNDDEDFSESESEDESGRKKAPKRKPSKYYESDDDGDFLESDQGEDLNESSAASSDDAGIEKILSYREKSGEREFYVKFRTLSYLHCDWVPEEEISAERQGGARIKRFLSKPLEERHYSKDKIFNPEYIQIERIIHHWDHPDENSAEMTASFMIKWVGLGYSESSWEKASTVESLPDGPEKLQIYRSRPTLAQKQQGMRPVGSRPHNVGVKTLEESPSFKNDNSLRSYQLEGLNWLIYCWARHQSCIIADEMGLGKTVQSVSFLNYIYGNFGVKGPFLIVAPLSTIPHWTREFQNWTNLNCIVYHGNIESRDLMVEYEFYYRDQNDKIIPKCAKFDVLITTYEMAISGISQLDGIVWRAAIFDEAHRLKNTASKASEILKSLKIEHKVLLTGTPLQNNVSELWSLLNFLQPQRFHSEDEFLHVYGNLQNSEDVIKLQKLLKPLMLRRLKEDVEKSIPCKEETVIEVELTSVQKRYYRAILEHNFAFLTKGCIGGNAPNLTNAMMELRKCCIHPYLISGSENRILKECNADGSLADSMNIMVQASGKLVLLDKLLKKLKEGNHRVLIFSQMTRCLDILSDYLKWRQYGFERIDGAVKGEDRQAAIDRFCDPESKSFVFLLCTRAGGVGINLTAADTVVIFDSDWNPQNDIQAQARCHRIGQTKAVKVYRLLTRNTYEREMFDKAGMKLGLDRAVLRKMLPTDQAIQNATNATHNPQLTKNEVETLLKKGAYGLLMENDEDSIKFCEEDIDQILERRTTVIRHDGADNVNPEGSIFSKASFAATADDLDVDIDDPNFWELWARRLDLDPRQLLSSSGVVVDEPRIKRQTRRIKNEDLSLKDLSAKISCSSFEPTARSDYSHALKWSNDERMAFLEQFLKFGIHRFDDMINIFPARSKNDLIACARAFIKKVLEASESSEDAKMREDNEKMLLAHLDFDRSALDESVDESGNIDMAAAEIANEQKKEETADLLKDFDRSEIPFSGANRRQILEFKSFIEFDFGQIIAGNAISILLRLQILDFIRQLVEGHATVAKQGAGKKAENITEYHLPVPNVAGTIPFKGWSKAEDEALVVGIYKHGYGMYKDLRADGLFSVMKWRGDKGSEDVDEKSDIPNWPDDEELEDRLKRVVIAMEKKTQAAAKLAIQAANSAKDGSRRKRNMFENEEDETYEEQYDPDEEYSRGGRRLKKTKVALDIESKTVKKGKTRWTKKDRNEFIKSVLNFGYPVENNEGRRDWSRFIELGNFTNTLVRAGNRAFDEYSQLFQKACELALLTKSKTKKNSKEDSAYEPEEDVEEESENSDLPVISTERAKRCIDRINLLGKVRSNVLKLEKLDENLSKSRRTSGLPSWWKTPDHDVQLLKAVGKWGFGQWESIVKDPDFEFCTVAENLDESVTEADNSRRSSRRASNSNSEDLLSKLKWPGESILIRRVDTIADLAISKSLEIEETSPAPTSLPSSDSSKKSKTKSKAKSKQSSMKDFVSK